MNFKSILAIAFFAASSQAAQVNVSGNSEFIAVGKPGFIKIHGTGSGVTGSISIKGNSVLGKFQFPLEKLSTGVDLRDEHMKKEYLETPKYPYAVLELKKVIISGDPETPGFEAKQAIFEGILTLRGVSKPVSGLIDIATSTASTLGDAQFEFKMSDYGFPAAKFLGMTVNDNVQVKVRIEGKVKPG